MSDQGVNFKITTSAELAALRATEAELVKAITAAKLAGSTTAAYSQEMAKLAAVQSRIKDLGMGGRMKAALEDAASNVPILGRMWTAANGAAGAITAGFAGAALAIKGAAASLREYAAAEVAVSKLDAALGNSGLLSDEYRGRLQQMASRNQQRTAISDESWLDVFATLTKFGAKPENIEGYSKAVENLAGLLGGDLSQAAFLVGKAMVGSTEMLGRYGIQVDKAKSKTEQLADIMRQLEARGGGQLEAAANTLEGRTRKIALAWSDVQEGIGQATLKLTDFLAKLAGKRDTAQYLEDFAGGLGVIAGMGGDKPNASGAKNRSVFIGDTPEKQAQADDLTARRAMMERWQNQLASEIAAMEKRRLALSQPAMAAVAGMAGVRIQESPLEREARLKQQADLDLQIATKRNNMESAAKTVGFFNEQARAAGLRDVSPQEAEQERAAQAEKAVLDAKRDELRVEVELAEAIRSGNQDQANRLKWLQIYNQTLAETQDLELARRAADASMPKSPEYGPAPATYGEQEQMMKAAQEAEKKEKVKAAEEAVKAADRAAQRLETLQERDRLEAVGSPTQRRAMDWVKNYQSKMKELSAGMAPGTDEWKSAQHAAEKYAEAVDKATTAQQRLADIAAPDSEEASGGASGRISSRKARDMARADAFERRGAYGAAERLRKRAERRAERDAAKRLPDTDTESGRGAVDTAMESQAAAQADLADTKLDKSATALSTAAGQLSDAAKALADVGRWQ